MAVAVEKGQLRLKGFFENNPTTFAEPKAHNTAVLERIIASGFGTEPTSEVKKMLLDKYGFDAETLL